MRLKNSDPRPPGRGSLTLDYLVTLVLGTVRTYPNEDYQWLRSVTLNLAPITLVLTPSILKATQPNQSVPDLPSGRLVVAALPSSTQRMVSSRLPITGPGQTRSAFHRLLSVEQYFAPGGVFVNVDDDAIRRNRKSMLNRMKEILILVGDISHLEAK